MSKASAIKSTSVKIKLQYPIEWGEDGVISEIELKRPKGKHIKGLSSDVGMTDIFKIASKVSNYTPAFFDEMDAADCMQVSEVIGNFLDNGQKTLKTS